MRSCNNCGVQRCNPGNKFICKKYTPMRPTVPLSACVSKVTFKTTDNPAFKFFLKHM